MAMADEQQELRQVNWNEVFAFTHIFKSFRMAMHLSKLLLGLAAIALICLAGVVLDTIWSWGDQYVRPQEIYTHFQLSPTDFQARQAEWIAGYPERAANLLAQTRNQAQTLEAYTSKLGYSGRLAAEFRKRLLEANQKDPPRIVSPDEFLADAKEDWKAVVAKAEEAFDDEVDRISALLEDSREAVRKDIAVLSADQEQQAREDLKAEYRRGRRALTERKVDFQRSIHQVRGGRIFSSLLAYQSACLQRAIGAVLRLDIGTGLSEYKNTIRDRSIAPAAIAVEPFHEPPPAEPRGFLYYMLLSAHGFCWLLSEHLLYGIIFLLGSLAIWAFFGGAIYRISALHAAREEKISIRQALKFSAGKFLSFFTAPLIPLAIIVALGVLMLIGGLLGNLWGFGAILVGVLFFLAILLGLLIAFLLVGLVGGFGLMYPTIAVEGSDSFDAISRSYSYIFARPWRSLLYGGVALIYGTLTYLFVRLFAYVALAATHTFVNWGIWTGGTDLAANASKLDAMWTMPTFDRFHGPISWAAMSGAEKIGAFFVAIWVYIIVGLVAAYLLSYFASSTTMIYYLLRLRRKVDATDLDDVYVEEPEEEPLPASAEEAEKPGEVQESQQQPGEQEESQQGQEERPPE